MATVRTEITQVSNVDGYNDINIEVFEEEGTVELAQDDDIIAFNISDLDDLIEAMRLIKESVK